MKTPRTLTYDPDREALAQAMRDALSQVLKETGLALTPWELNKWRPTRRVTDALLGLEVRVTILATDGNLAIFQRVAACAKADENQQAMPVRSEAPGLWEDESAAAPSYFIGHIQRFAGEVAPLLSLAKGGTGASSKTARSPSTAGKLTRAEKLAKL